MFRMMSAMLVWWLAVSCGSASDWPQFRGQDARASAVQDGPTEWNADTNLLWKVALPGPGASSPITYGDRVYVTCYTGYGTGNDQGRPQDLVRHLLCLDSRDGRVLWTCKLESRSPEADYRGFMTQHGYASNTPATDGESIYVFLGTGGVAAVDREGHEVWRSKVGAGTDGWGSGSSVRLTDDLVIVSAAIESSALVALRKTDGSEAWRVEIPHRSWSTPAIVANDEGKPELVVSGEGKIVGIEPSSGRKMWQCDGITDYTCPSVVPGKGVVYVGGGRRSEIIAVRTGGSGDVTKTHRLWEKRVGGNVTTPVLHGDYLFGVSDRGIAYCLDAKTGEVKYNQRLAGGEAVAVEPGGPAGEAGPRGPRGERGGPGGPGGRRGRGERGGGGPGGFGGGLSLYASVVCAGDKVYAITRNDGAFVYSATPEFKLLATNRIDSDKSRFDATPALGDGRLYLRSNEALYCIGKKE